MADIGAQVVGQNVDGGASQTSPADSFSFSGLHEQAMNFVPDTPEGGAEASVTPEQVLGTKASTPDAKQESNEVAQNVDNASAAQLAKLNDTDLVEVTVDGQSVQLPWSEAKGGVMRQAKFTKEMQSLRREQEQFNQQREASTAEVTKLQQEHTALVSLLQNKDLLQQFLNAKYPDLVGKVTEAAAQAMGVDPEDIATVGQLQQVQARAKQELEQIAENLTKNLEAREASIATRIEDRQATLKLSTEINSTIGELFKSHPYIEKVVPNAEQLLRWNVHQLKPGTVEDTLEAFKTVFGGWVENYKATVAETTKQSVVDKQKLVSNNIQPPGGAGPQPQPTSFKKTNSMTGKQEIDWAALREAAMSMTRD